MAVLEGLVTAEGCSVSSEAGFSLVETLIAALLFLVVVVGMLPLFLSSIVNNNAGNDYLHATNFARSDLEQLHKVPFTDPSLAIAGGSTSQTTTDYFTQNPLLTSAGQWLTTATASAPQVVLWQRSATVREYSVDALADGNLTTDEALDGASDPIFVHLKEVRVQLTGQRQTSSLGPARQLTFRVLKAF
jgi:Tfp pilus assembly protein PilV